MKKIMTFFILVICMLGLNFCSQNNNDSIFENANYDSKTNTLKVDYSNNPDTSILQIIALSNIRQTGYGILLNIENTYPKSDLDALKLKFQKVDINAIHSYDISLTDSLEAKVQIAIEGAKFVWLLGSSGNDWKSKPIGQLISNLHDTEEDKVLVVLD